MPLGTLTISLFAGQAYGFRASIHPNTMAETFISTHTREKQWAAATSVVAALFLTGLKIVIGLRTDSLGILAEAAHSGLDLVAAVITLLAVRVSDRPADEQHMYGHGKVENLSALVETLLLLASALPGSTLE